MRRHHAARQRGTFSVGLLLLIGCCAAPLPVRAAGDALEIPISVSPEGKPLQPRKIEIPNGPVLPKPLAEERWRQERSGALAAPMQASSLVLDDPRKRGLSDDVWARPGSLHMAGIGVVGGLEQNPFGTEGSHQPDGKPRGVILSQSLSGADEPEALALTGTYVKTEATVDSLGQIEGSSGDATNLALDSRLLDGRLHLRGQYAVSRYDADGPLLDHDLERGNAYDLSARLNAAELPLAGKALRWAVGTRHSEVAGDFHSPANPGLPSDQRLSSVFSELSWGSVSAIGEMARSENNLDREPTHSRTRNEAVSARVHYRPNESPTDATHLFDRPDLELSYREGGAKDAVGNPLNTYEEVGMSASFSPGEARWRLGYSVGRNRDETGWGPDSVNQTRSIDLSLPLGPYMTFKPSFQDREQVYVDTDVAEKHLDVGARLDVALANKWSGSLGYRLSTHGASDGSVDASSDELSARVEHRFLSPRPDRPGVKMHLKGSYQDYENDLDPAGNYDERDAEVGVQLDWPLD